MNHLKKAEHIKVKIMKIKYKSMGDIGLKLEIKTAQATPNQINQMMNEIENIVSKYGYKVGEHGNWENYREWTQNEINRNA
jgi:hypothetical protein